MKDFNKNPEVQAAIKQIISELKNKEQNYFEIFKEAITSGNHITVKNQLNKTNNDIQKIAESKGVSKNRQKRGIKPGFVLYVGYSYVGVTHIVAALALKWVAAGTSFYVGAKKRGKRSVEVPNSLTQDQYIDLIVQRIGK